MKAMQLLDEIEFREKKPEGQPLYVDRNGRIIRFALKPGQAIKEHNAPDSPFYAVVLKGRGMFAGNSFNPPRRATRCTCRCKNC